MPGLVMVELALLDEDPANPRGVVGDVTDLKNSIAQDGQQDPIHVIPQPNGRYLLHEGHRRRKALLELGATHAKALERRFATDLDRFVSQGLVHIHRRNFDPMAWARYVHRLCWEYNLDRDAIARRLGVSQLWVRDHLSFNYLLDYEQRALQLGEITRAEALRRLAVRRAERDGTPLPASKKKNRKNAPPAAAAAAPPRAGDPHFNGDHPLAELVTARCTAAGHHDRPKTGGVGCGPCWEDAIRDDATARRRLAVA